MTEKRDQLDKKDVLAMLRRAGVGEETIRALDAELDDPVDRERVASLAGRYGITLDQLIDRMGGSP
jgi:uncharacterized membrane protein YebE (DUF533 family)